MKFEGDHMGKQSQVEKTRQEIKDAFVEMYLQKDMNAITVKDICNRIPIARTAFYRYFDDVYAVYEEIEKSILLDLGEMNREFYLSDFKASEPDGLRGAKDSLDYIAAREKTFKALIRNSGTSGFIYKWKKQMKAHFERKYLNESNHKAQKEIYLEFTVSGIIGLYEYWLYHPDKISKKEILHGLYEMICRELDIKS